MAKTELTEKLENQIYAATCKQGIFGCFEVTIGWFGRERVDYMTYDTKGVWRCYEIKVSVADFRSKAKKTFCGHFNYYVLTRELYEKVKDEIPAHIGVYIGGTSVKRAKRQELTVEEEVLKDSMIRSLCRESGKLRKSENPKFIENTNKRIRSLEDERSEYRRRYQEISNLLYAKLGRGWKENLEAMETIPRRVLHAE
ncbi:hypothetical protein [Terribacillus sp. JSM ZJ617]|uniref:hypothetical protein n=1 Tax=Terribacillus sp. JSM ZJ617 TaxID=3342119 RepID=UPI0035A83416